MREVFTFRDASLRVSHYISLRNTRTVTGLTSGEGGRGDPLLTPLYRPESTQLLWAESWPRAAGLRSAADAVDVSLGGAAVTTAAVGRDVQTVLSAVISLTLQMVNVGRRVAGVLK